MTTYVFVYCNPNSGGNKAGALLQLPAPAPRPTEFSFLEESIQRTIEVKIFNLKQKESREQGFDLLAAVKKNDAEADVRAVAAGGDGTVKWVISELTRVGCVDTPIGVIPFGTGNDMARVLGWGSTAPSPLVGAELKALKGIIRDLAMAETVPLDVWKVEMKVNPNLGRIDVAVKGQIVERPDKAKTVVEHMINYCSFGDDARAVFGFERRRRTTQFMNKVQFAIEGGKLALPTRGRKLDDSALTVDGDHVPEVHENQGVIFQNIPSYAAGSDFWGGRKWNPGDKLAPQLVGDGFFEVYRLKRVIHIGLSKATLGLSEAADRAAQGKSARLEFHRTEVDALPVYAQVDGEPCRLVHLETCTIEKAFTAYMLTRNAAKMVLLRSLSDNDRVLKTGYLLKSRSRLLHDVWKMRFCALVQRGDRIVFEWFLDETKRGDIVYASQYGKPQEQGKIHSIEHHGPRPHTAFSVVVGKRHVHFAGKSQAERDEWIAEFQNNEYAALAARAASASNAAAPER